MSDWSPQRGSGLSACSHLAIFEYSAYIPDMSREDSKRARHRQRQAAYEARVRAGVMLYLVPLGSDEIDALMRLRWLPADAECSREQVGAAAAAALRSILR
jgi:hypothetical protein